MRLLDSLGPYAPDQVLAVSTQLRAQCFAPDLVSEALTQSRLRAAGAEKFGEFASRMLFTQAGLEQATRMSVAALHAQRFVASGVTSVADLGCGIGADAMAFAGLDLNVVAVERDPTTAAVATVNLMPFPNARVVAGDAQAIDWEAVPGGRPESLWLDPARRTDDRPRSGSSQRIFDPEAFSPPLSFVLELAATGVPMGVKMGPGMPHSAIPANCEAQWVSHRGDVVEVVLWFNALARPGVRRSALVLRQDGPAQELTSTTDFPDLTDEPESRDSLPFAEEHTPSDPLARQTHPDVRPGSVLWEPDGAVIRAGLVQDVAEHLGAQLIHPRIAYLVAPSASELTCGTGDAASSSGVGASGLSRGYTVREVLPHTVKVLKSWVKTNKVGTLEIKKRGTDVTPEQLRKQLKPSGPNKATLIVTRMATPDGERRVILVVDPIR
ncbi:THUMP-like domain-containing protein [Kocuria sp.]|uniref:THUMP-like domain-containing protein n=1 Tax=Kocuria sp. TaxID=1871328 RepID=UPI0026DFF81B|nr:SAM-dependent methyltransferase [Kocuria sp.]MDO5617328.1 SAM-dependent methyltransferase [Kocuria sp.]